MQVNPTYAQVCPKNPNGTQNISLYNPKTHSYQSLVSSPTDIDTYIKNTNSKRITANIITAISSFGVGVGIASLINKFLKGEPKINLVFSGAILSAMTLIGNLGDSFVYTKENKKFISEQKAKTS